MKESFLILVALSAIIWAFSQPSLSAYLPLNSQLEDSTYNDIMMIAHTEAELNDYDPAAAKAQIIAESGGRRYALSRSGAQGVAQIMPETAKAWKVNPWKPAEAIHAMVVHMKAYKRTYARKCGADKAQALAWSAYNAGPNATKGCEVAPYKETQGYIGRIKSLMKSF